MSPDIGKELFWSILARCSKCGKKNKESHWLFLSLCDLPKMSTSFSRLTSYLIQLYLLKQKNVLGLYDWWFPGKFTILKQQKQPMQVFCKKWVLKNFTMFTWKHLCWSLLADLHASNFIKRFQCRCFPVGIGKFLRAPILKNIWEWLLNSYFKEH